MNDIALLSMDALREYIEKISTKIVNGQGSRNVVSGTIKSAKTDGYEIQLTNGETESMVHATALYDADYKLNDYVYLISAEVQKGSIYTTNYFIFGLVSAVQQNFANLTEWERFQANETVKYDSATTTQIPALGAEEESILTLVKGDENEKGIISALNLQGAIAIYANFNTGRLLTAKDYGLKLRFYANDILRSEHKLNVDYFIGQPFNLTDQPQKRLIILGEEAAAITKIDIIPYSEYETVSKDFTVSKIQLQVGTVFNTIDNLKVTIKNTNGKNYFFKEENEDEIIEITATAKYNSQSLFGEGIKYYWFIEDKDVVVGSDGYNSIAGEGWYCLNESQQRKYTNENGEVVTDEIIKIYSASDNILKLDAQNFKSHLKQYKNKIKCILGYQLSNAESNEIEVYNFSKESYDVSIEKVSGNLPLLRPEETIKLKAKITNNNAEEQETDLGVFTYCWQRKTEDGWKDITAETQSNIYNEKYWIQIPASYNGVKWTKKPVYKPYLNENYDGETALYIWNENTYEQVTDFTYGKPYFYIGHYEMEESDSGTYYKKQFTYTKETLIIGDSGKDPTDEYYNMQGRIEKIRCEIFKKVGESYESFGVTATDEEDGYIIESFVNVEGSIEERVFYKYLIDESNAVTFIKNQVKEEENNKVLFSYYKYEPKDGNWLSTPSYDLTGVDDAKSNLEFINSLRIFGEYFSKSENEENEPYLYYTYYSEFYEVKKLEETNVIVKTLKRIDDWALPQILKQAKKTNDGTIVSIKTEEEIAQINTFNLLTNGGKKQGIFYGDATYNITDDIEPIQGKIYYKKVVETNDEGKETVTFEIITIENNEFPTNIGYIYESNGDHLYINAEYIQTGALRVGDENSEVFYANLDNPEVRIAGFTVDQNSLVGPTIKNNNEEEVGKLTLSTSKIEVPGLFGADLETGKAYLNGTVVFSDDNKQEILDIIANQVYIESVNAFNAPNPNEINEGQILEESAFFSKYTGVVDPSSGDFTSTYVWQTTKTTFSDGKNSYSTPIRVDDMRAASLAAKYQIKDNIYVNGYYKDNKFFPKIVEEGGYPITSEINGRFEDDCDEGDVGRWCALYDRTIISGGAITTGTITAEQIAANSITANEIDTTGLSAEKIEVWERDKNGNKTELLFRADGTLEGPNDNLSRVYAKNLESVSNKTGLLIAGNIQSENYETQFNYINNGSVSYNHKFNNDNLLNKQPIYKNSNTAYFSVTLLNPEVINYDNIFLITDSLKIDKVTLTYKESGTSVSQVEQTISGSVTNYEYEINTQEDKDNNKVNSQLKFNSFSFTSETITGLFANAKILFVSLEIEFNIEQKNYNGSQIIQGGRLKLDEEVTSLELSNGNLEILTQGGYYIRAGKEFSSISIDSSDYLSLAPGQSRLAFFPEFIQVSISPADGTGGDSTIPIQFVNKVTFNYDFRLNGTWYIHALSADSPVQSDLNKKHEIILQPEIYSCLFDKLEPVIYKYNDGSSNRIHTGMIAQSVEQAVIDCGLTTQDFAGVCYDINEKTGEKENYRLRYGEFISMCIYEIQQNKKKIAELEAKISELNNNN